MLIIPIRINSNRIESILIFANNVILLPVGRNKLLWIASYIASTTYGTLLILVAYDGSVLYVIVSTVIL